MLYRNKETIDAVKWEGGPESLARVDAWLHERGFECRVDPGDDTLSFWKLGVASPNYVLRGNYVCSKIDPFLFEWDGEEFEQIFEPVLSAGDLRPAIDRVLTLWAEGGHRATDIACEDPGMPERLTADETVKLTVASWPDVSLLIGTEPHFRKVYVRPGFDPERITSDDVSQTYVSGSLLGLQFPDGEVAIEGDDIVKLSNGTITFVRV